MHEHISSTLNGKHIPPSTATLKIHMLLTLSQSNVHRWGRTTQKYIAKSPKVHLLWSCCFLYKKYVPPHLRESAFLFADDVKMALPRSQSSFIFYSLSSSLAMK